MYKAHTYTLDEAIAHFKGRNKFLKVYLKDKPYRWGIKEYVLCSSLSNYTFRSIIYTPKSEKEPNYVANLVLRIINGIVGFNDQLWMDNYYTSYKVIADLFDNSIRAAGTTRIDRLGLSQN